MQEDIDFSVKYVLCMRHTVVLILTGTCVLRPVSTCSHCTNTNQHATCSSDTPTPASSSHSPT